MNKITFEATNLFLQSFRSSPDSFRVSAETGINEFENIKNIPKLAQDKNYRITIEEIE